MQLNTFVCKFGLILLRFELIVYILKETGRPLRSSEIIDILKRNDIKFRVLTDHQKGLSAHLTKAIKYGRIVGTKQKGQNGYLFSLS